MKGYLLDTNVVSETRRPRPNESVTAFLAKQNSDRLFLSVLTLGELRKGVESRARRDPDGALRLTRWLDELELEFVARVLPIDREIADVWGKLSADRPRPVIDTLLAATALVHRLVLVTRNLHDFNGLGVDLLDPFTGGNA